MINKVRIIIAKVENLEAYVSTVSKMISPRYLKKYYSSKVQSEANQALASGLLLRKYLGINSNDHLVIGKYGKPALKNKDEYFNISYSGEFVALAITNVPVGVDIEEVSEVCWPAAKRVLVRDQYERLHEMDDKEQRFSFAKLWTETEAVLKLAAIGFNMDPKEENFKRVECSLNSVLHSNYIITCATYEEANILLEEAQLIEVIGEKEVNI